MSTQLILPKDVDSKFRFITVASQRAKQLQNGAMPVVVVGITGCIAAYKACELVRELQKREVDVWAVMTANATRFVTPLTLETLTHHPVFTDQFVLGEGSDIRHISLADSADLLLIAPATANTIGKLAQGIADDALSTLYTATTAPVLIAPAMNVNMLRHPAVLENLALLRSRGAGILEPGSGYLACGWLGEGRLADTPEIVEAAMAALARRRDLEGETVLVTAGPTVEDIDPVRFVSNRSTGRMGYRLAEAARRSSWCRGPRRCPCPRASTTCPSVRRRRCSRRSRARWARPPSWPWPRRFPITVRPPSRRPS